MNKMETGTEVVSQKLLRLSSILALNGCSRMLAAMKNLFKVGYNNIVYSKNRATNSNQLFTKIHYLQFQPITDITITIISIP